MILAWAAAQMYRSWQRRHAERANGRGRARAAGGEPTPAQTTVTVPNATDVFYLRLNAALEVRPAIIESLAAMALLVCPPNLNGSAEK